jgi:hypothetical protein
VILVDSDVPMYLVGADHPNKGMARSLLELAVVRRERLVTDAEVIQEILHRYAAIDRRTYIEPAVDALLGVVDEVYPSSWLTSPGPVTSCSPAGGQPSRPRSRAR